MKITTIWNTYGPYHLARVDALERVIPNSEITCLAHCNENDDYKFFSLRLKNLIILVDKNSSKLRFWESFIATFKALNITKPELVLACGYERSETFASLIWSKINGATIFLMLDNQRNDKKRNYLIESIKVCYLFFFDGFVYGGNTHEDYLRFLRVPLNKEVVGYNCVNNAEIFNIVGNIKSRGDSPFHAGNYFLCVARLVPKKNLVRLVEAYSKYVKSLDPWVEPWDLVICGEGSERIRIETAIVEKGVTGRVRLVGRVDDFSMMLNYYAFAKLLILPSHENEQWGLVVNEAMASGLPVLVSEACGCADSLVFNGVNGFKFNPFSTDDIAKLMVIMQKSKAALPSMGNKSIEIVSKYSPDQFARNIFDLYHRVKSDCA